MKGASQIDHLRIASPCPVGWERMSGGDRVRFCDQCSLHVYNIAELTRTEAETLIANTEGRICARMYRRADGTIITKDCPVGLRAIRHHTAKVAGAVLAAVISLASTVLGQKPGGKDKACRQQVMTTRTVTDSATGVGALGGKIQDPNGAVMAGAVITITDLKTKKARTTVSDAEGRFLMSALDPGAYTIEVSSIGFKKLVLQDVMLAGKESVNFEIILIFDSTTVTIGILASEPSIIDLPLGTFIINEKMIRSLPIPQD